MKKIICIFILILLFSNIVFASELEESSEITSEYDYQNYNYQDYNYEYKRLRGTVIEAR